MTTRRYQAKTHKLKHLRYKRAEPAAGDWGTREVLKWEASNNWQSLLLLGMQE